MPSSDYYEGIQLRTNWPTVLPCQVNSPDAKVTLHREFPPVEVPVDGTDISFDVKKGFTIHRPRPHHAGALFCVASLGNLRQSSTKYMLIYVHCECCHSCHMHLHLQITLEGFQSSAIGCLKLTLSMVNFIYCRSLWTTGQMVKFSYCASNLLYLHS